MQTLQNTSIKIESSSHRGDFTLRENGRKINELKYKNWYSGITETYLDRKKIQLKPKNWWSGKIEIIKNGRKTGEIFHNAKLHMMINLVDEDRIERKYTLKNTGTWKFKFELSSESEKSLLILTPKSTWKSLDFDVQVVDENLPFEELTIYVAYACKLYYAYISAG